MQWREQTERWVVENGKKRIAKELGSKLCRLQRYWDALIDEVWMVDGEGSSES